MYNMPRVAAGKLGSAAAIGFVRLAKPTLAMSSRTFMAPITVPTVCWTFRRPATAFSPGPIWLQPRPSEVRGDRRSPAPSLRSGLPTPAISLAALTAGFEGSVPSD